MENAETKPNESSECDSNGKNSVAQFIPRMRNGCVLFFACKPTSASLAHPTRYEIPARNLHRKHHIHECCVSVESMVASVMLLWSGKVQLYRSETVLVLVSSIQTVQKNTQKIKQYKTNKTKKKKIRFWERKKFSAEKRGSNGQRRIPSDETTRGKKNKSH